MGVLNKAAGFGLGWMGKKLDGKKTVIGAVGMIMMGVAGLLGKMFPDQTYLPDYDVETAFGLISGGFVALGLGGKAEKIIQSNQK